ncbi:MAG TPA: sigma-70 family RNA polymerase sigma factor [Blastocatellia bacterium]
MMTLTLSAGLPERLPEIAKADAERAPERPAENLGEAGFPASSEQRSPVQSGPPGPPVLPVSIDNMSVGDMDDHQLLAASSAGAEDAFLEITRRYRNQITNYVYRMLDDYDRAVDLTQETFVRVWVNAARYQATYSFSTYIYKIAHNLAISELRQRKRRRTIQFPTFFSDRDNEEMEVEIEDQKQPLAEDVMIGDERRRAVSRAIASLPEKYRAALVLCDIEEKSYDEISEVLGLPVGTVKSRINRARNLLKEKLRDYL